MTVYCRLILAQGNVSTNAMKQLNIATAALGSASSSLASRKEGLACVVLPDAEITADVLLNISEVTSQ